MKKRLYSAILAIASLCFTSCSDLDFVPTTAIDPETLGQNEVEQLLTGTYCVLQSDPGRDTWVLFDMRAENLSSTYLSGENQFVVNNIDESNSTLLTMWSGYYRAIYEANLTIATLADLEDTDANLNIEAQARFLRAYCYYCLATRWDGVPLITENTLDLVRRDYQDVVFDFVKSELDYCISSGTLYSFSSVSGAPYLVTLEAAKALRARLALALDDMTTAATLAEEVVESGYFTLSSDYDAIFTSSLNSEFIFAFANNTTEDPVNLYALFTTYSSPISGSWFLCPSPEAQRMFDDDNDTRKSTCINVLVTDAGESYDLMNKFRDYSPLIVSRIAEMYLISAEAQGLAGVDRLNELRVKRGLDELYFTSETEYQEAVALERRKELYSEGFLYYDLVRTGKVTEEVETMVGKTDFYLPLPESELTSNPELQYYND